MLNLSSAAQILGICRKLIQLSLRLAGQMVANSLSRQHPVRLRTLKSLGRERLEAGFRFGKKSPRNTSQGFPQHINSILQMKDLSVYPSDG
jgi:hypothetical protein